MKRHAFLKSALALMLCLSMVLSFVPMQVAAAEEPVAVAHDCEKDGHTYKATKIEATCKQYPCTRHTCSACGDSYDVYPDELYSDWQETKPDVDETLIQSKTQYRTSQYETVISVNTALEGYEQIGSQWDKGDIRTIAYVASWPAGFDRTSSIFRQYDRIAQKVSASESENRKTEINSDEIVGYLYYHWCYEGHPYTVDTETDTFNRFHAYYSTKAPEDADSYDIGDNSFRFDDSTACSDSKWYFYVPVYEQNYTDYRREYIYGTWGNFSDWSDTAVTGTDTLKVGTRTVYRYVNAEMAKHSYDSVTTPAGCTTPGQTVYTCSACGHSYTDTLPQAGHSYEKGKCTVCGGNEPNYYLIGYINGADYGCEGDYENMGTYKFVNGKLVVTFKQDSYVFIKTEGNAAWYMTETYVSDDTATFKNTNTGAAEKMFVPGGVELTFTLTYGEGDTLTLSHVGGPCNHNYEETILTAPTCTEGGQGKYVCSKCGESETKELDAKGHDYRRGICKNCGRMDETYVTPNYYLVGYINGVDYGSVDDFENRGEFRFEDGKLVINCTEDSYVFVKTEGNTAWYMTNEYCTDTSAVLYDTRDGSYEKMFIPAHMEVTFTLKESANNSLTLSYVAVPCKHNFADSVLVEADCFNDGIMLRTCRVCTATAEKPIPTNGHDYKKVVTEVGCLTDGYTTYTCNRCGESHVGDEVKATGHNYETKVIKEPGCETAGLMDYTCSGCGDSYTGTIAATGHNYQRVVTKPTCTEPGFTTTTCSGCGHSYVSENVSATGHDYKGVTNIAPTCVTDGRKTYTCTGCGDAYIQVMEAMGHNYVSVVTKPTCTEKGFTTHRCTICGNAYTDTYVNATGHKFVNGKCSICGEVSGSAYYLFGFINGANYACDEDWENMGIYRFQGGKLVVTFKADSYIGIKKEGNAAWYMCEKFTDGTTGTFKNTSTGAGEKMLVPGGVELTLTLVVNADDTLTMSYTAVPCDHSYSSVITTMPTCETSGVKTYTCSKCGGTYTDILDAAGHSYKAVVTKPTCTAQGFTTYTCLICKDNYTDKLVPATGHTLESKVTKAPGCETTGLKTYTCKNCNHSYTEKIDATGHNYKSVVTKPGCETVGFTTHTCADCGDTYKDKEVPAIGHDYTSTVTVKPTCDAPGTASYTCGNCGDTFAEELSATGHNFVEGKCSVCGKSETCEHNWVDGICDICGVVCEHEYVYGICTKCSGQDPFYVPSYYLVGYINGANYGCEDDYENMGQYKFEDNKLVVTFDQDSYVFLKTEGNASWYMTEKYTEDTTATFKNTSTGAGEKLFVPGGVEWSFVLTVNADDTLTLTYGIPTCDHDYKVTAGKDATCTEDGSATYTCTLCGDSYTETLPAPGHSFEAGKCVSCGAKDPNYVPTYYLIGYINGADYGCNDDYQNMGQYKFVNGKLVATFKQDSYVFLKNEDNTGWYMTKSYVDKNTATFYNTSAGANEKMFVPGNVELIFTLTVGENDTLTLTYANADCDHDYKVTATKDATCTEAGSTTYTCALCGDSYTETVPATGHSYTGGLCGVCGEKDPNYIPEDGNYTLVTDLSQVMAGGQFVLVAQNGESYQAMDTTLASGKFVGVDVTVKDNVLAGSDLPVWTIETVEGGIAIRVGDSYLAYNSSTNFKLQAEAYAWSVEDGFLFTASTATRGIYYQKSSDKFGAYATSNATNSGYVSGLQLYRYEVETPECKHNWVNGSCSICGEKQPDYYLVGYINGADYGCNDDYANMGDYKFVNGKLVVTFTQDSYVFLKTTGNADWYMSQAYSDGTTAIFHNTATGAEEKLFVPGGVEVTFTLTVNSNDTLTLSYTTAVSVKPTLALKSPTLEFKDMICIVVFYTAENTQDVVEMGMITYKNKVTEWNVETADYVIPGANFDAGSGRYYSSSQGIHAKYLADTLYLACYAKLADGTYVYTKLAPYSPITYANNQLKNSTNTALKQLVVSMLNYGAEAQLYFGHNVTNLANSALTAEQKALPEAYRADMTGTVPSASAAKQGIFASNKGFSARKPAISFEGAFCINYFFTPAYAPVDGITLYYWNEADYNAASVLTVENASGSLKMEGTGVGQYRGDIEGISAKSLSQAVYVAAVYSDGTTTWTSGVLGYSIGAYCSSQASKGGDVAALAMATAVYGYHAKQYFG